MGEPVEGMGSAPEQAIAGLGGGGQARYGLVFCELPPPPDGQGSGRPAKPPPRAPGSEAAPRSRDRAHGTYAKAVVERCDCPRCRKARTDYNRRRRQAMARPDEVWAPYVSAEPARLHLAALSAAGMGLKTVASLSGVSRGALSQVVYGEPGRGRPPSRRIRPQTLERILAVRATDAGGHQLVSAERTWQLIGELVAAGYTRAELARALGSRAARPRLQLGRHRVRAATARSVELMHRGLIARPPPRSQR